MKITKAFKFAQLTLLILVIGFCVSCANFNEKGKTNAPEAENTIFYARSQSVERDEPTLVYELLHLDSVPQSEITLSAKATQTATANWFFKYEDGYLKVDVYVEDPVLYKANLIPEYNDYVEVLFSKTSGTQRVVSVLVNAYGDLIVKDASGNLLADHGVIANACDFTLAEDRVDGWRAQIAYPCAISGEDGAEPNLTVCLSLSNSDSKLEWQTVDYEGIKTDRNNPESYLWVKESGALEQNPNLYHSYDGIRVDGARDEKYGEFTDTVTLSGDRWFDISAVKTENGVFVYTRALFNTSHVDQTGSSWGRSTDFEFKLNAGATSYVNIEGGYLGVTDYVLDVVRTDTGKYLHALEFFVEKQLIKDWNIDKDVQINYAWKSTGESSYILSDMLHAKHCDWSSDWHSYQRLGGLSTSFVELPANLMISTSGLTTATAPENGPAIDGNFDEYSGDFIVKGDMSKAVVKTTGKVVNGDLYMGLTITHGDWSTYTKSWWNNDNIEMHINGEHVVFMFYAGELIIPEAIDEAVAVTTTDSNGKLVTNVEFYIQGNSDAYKVKMGMNGYGFKGWQGLSWNGADAIYVTEEGVSEEKTLSVGALALDGELTEEVWSESVKANTISTTANGAEIEIMGRLLENGTVFGVTVLHTKAPNVSVNGENNWWNYMNIEAVINGHTGDQFIATVKNDRSEHTYSYCKTESTPEGKYLSTFEIFVPNGITGITADQKCASLAFGGWFESKFSWLFGTNGKTTTHYISNEGISMKSVTDDGVLRILTIGNSFSDDTMEYVGKIAESYGMQVFLGNLYIGGCNINYHLDNLKNESALYTYRVYSNGAWKNHQNYKSTDAIKSQSWDYISFQQASPDSGRVSTMTNLEALMAGVRAICNQDAKFIWHMTWAYQADSNHSGFANYNNSQDQMYEAIIQAVQSVVMPNEQFALVAPVGTAIQNARTSILGDRLTRDGYHLNLEYGRYIAGLTFFSAITGVDVSKVSYVAPGIPADIKVVCVEAAVNAVKNPFTVTYAATR